MYLGRTVFQFYTIVFEPYLLLGLTGAIGIFLGLVPWLGSVRHKPVPSEPGERVEPDELEAERQAADADHGRRNRIRVVVAYLVLAVLVSAFFYPLWTGMQTSFLFWQMHIWLPSWR
jgi:dolichyl-phosphate-mannose-protein mannosyltransferase